MRLTPEQKWYTNAGRRAGLLKRANLLALHSIVGAPENTNVVDQPTIIKCNTHNGLYQLSIPNMSKDNFKDPAIGKIYLTDRQVMSAEDKTAILTDYCTIHLYDIDFAVDLGDNDEIILISLGSDKETPLYKTKEWLIIESGDIENFIDKTPIVTTHGRYIVNYFLLASTFCKDKYIADFKYINDVIDVGSIEKIISSRRINPEHIGKYIDHGYYLSSIGDIAGTVATWNSIVPNDEVLKRRDELYKQYEGQHNDPRIMAVIENELINMDKEFMKNDPSMDFLGDTGTKFNIHRKRMNISIGLMEEFGAEKGKYNYITNSLSEGWDKTTFNVLQDDSRKGFYGRAVETQVAGTDTKLMISNFQSSTITHTDCGTKRLLSVEVTKETAKSFIGAFVRTGTKHKILVFPKFKEDPRYFEEQTNITITVDKPTKYQINDYVRSPGGNIYLIVDMVENNDVITLSLTTTLVVDDYDVITPDNYTSYIGKTIQIRSMQYCAQVDGYCSVCAYKTFNDIGLLNVGAGTVDLGGVFLNLSMKSMHGTKVDVMQFRGFNEYVINP